MASDGILMVDDEQPLLDGLQRQLHRRMPIETACGAEAGLAAIAARPFAVVCSDLRMPGIDGVRFLAEVRTRAPDAVRIMLTGGADLHAAMEAVNRDNLFRFLTKPCPIDDLCAALEAGLAQYRLVTAEKDLLEKTLSGSVRVLTDLLALANPRAFGRAVRLKRVARRIAEAVGHPAPWQVELAAMMSQLGAVTVPVELIDRAEAGEDLREDERRMLAGLPEVTARLLANIPRLEGCARIIAASGAAEPPAGDDAISGGARVLRLIQEYEGMIASGVSAHAAMIELRMHGHTQAAVEALRAFDVAAGSAERRQLAIQSKDLHIGMILDADVHALNGILLVARGQEVTHALIARLSNFRRLVGIAEPVRVLS